MKSFTAVYKETGKEYKWYFNRDKNGWWLHSYDGVIRYLEKTWIDSLPKLHLILENHGMVANIS